MKRLIEQIMSHPCLKWDAVNKHSKLLSTENKLISIIDYELKIKIVCIIQFFK
jgi:hypothetical protein